MDLNATPQADGSIRFAWTSGQPGKRVNYIVEGRPDGGDWTFLTDGGATKATVAAFAPGASATYRVSASANGQRSYPSNEATVFPSAPALRVVDGGERRAA